MQKKTYLNDVVADTYTIVHILQNSLFKYKNDQLDKTQQVLPTTTTCSNKCVQAESCLSDAAAVDLIRNYAVYCVDFVIFENKKLESVR